MPPAVAVGAIIGGITTAGGIAAFFGVSVTAGFLIGATATGLSLLYFRNKAPKLPRVSPPDTDYRQSIPAAVLPARHIYGRARVGGTPIFFGEFKAGNGTSEWAEGGGRFSVQSRIMLLSEGAIDGIDRVYIDGARALDLYAAEPHLTDAAYNAEVDLWQARLDTIDGDISDPENPPSNVAFLRDYCQARYDELWENRNQRWSIRGGDDREHPAVGWYVHDGTEDSAMNTAFRDAASGDVAIGNGRWTAEHKLLGVSAVGVFVRNTGTRDVGIFKRQPPRFEFLVKGKKIVWPGQSTPTWTENAAAIYHDWMVNVQGVPAADIDRAAFDAAYARCNEQVVVPEVQRGDDAETKLVHATDVLEANFGDDHDEWPSVAIQDVLLAIWNADNAGADNAELRYSINGIVDTSMDPLEVERQFNVAWAGFAVERNGKIYFEPGTAKPAADSIGEDDLVDAPNWEIEPPLSQRATSMSADIVQSRKHDYLRYSVPKVHFTNPPEDDYTQDLGQWAYVNSPIAATRIMHILLRRANGGKKVRLTTWRGNDWDFYRLAPTDRVRLDLETEGDTGNTYFIESRTTTMEGTVEIAAAQEQPGTYDDTVTVPLEIDVGSAFLTGTGLARVPPQGVVVELHAAHQSPLEYVMRIGVNGSVVDPDAASMQARVRLRADPGEDDNDWRESLTANFISVFAAGTYEFQARWLENGVPQSGWSDTVQRSVSSTPTFTERTSFF